MLVGTMLASDVFGGGSPPPATTPLHGKRSRGRQAVLYGLLPFLLVLLYS